MGCDQLEANKNVCPALNLSVASAKHKKAPLKKKLMCLYDYDDDDDDEMSAIDSKQMSNSNKSYLNLSLSFHPESSVYIICIF